MKSVGPNALQDFKRKGQGKRNDTNSDLFYP